MLCKVTQCAGYISAQYQLGLMSCAWGDRKGSRKVLDQVFMLSKFPSLLSVLLSSLVNIMYGEHLNIRFTYVAVTGRNQTFYCVFRFLLPCYRTSVKGRVHTHCVDA